MSVPGRWIEVHEQHRQLIDLIQARNGSEAGVLAERHISQARDIRLSLTEDY
ncbi:hypothetical protein HQP03_25425 [Rhodococcus fascians]|nr:hypothetical protein [Rhodococcus fascians]MBY4106337.1 hypothetical protein [Rhodococcus fascians]